MVDRMSPLPLYAQVAAALRARMVSGELAPGDQIPGELELMETYQVHRSTVRHALAVLREEGRIFTLPARGSYVAERPRRRRVASDLTAAGQWRGWWKLMHEDGQEPVSQLTVSWGPPPNEVAAALGLEPGTDVLIRHRVQGIRDEPPMQLTTSYVPRAIVDRIPILTEQSTGPGGGLARLEDAGYGPLGFEEIVSARLADEAERALALVTEAEPVVLTALGITYSHVGEPLHAMVRTMAAARLELGFRFGAIPESDHEETEGA